VDTVLAHLTVRLSAHPENVATEALGYILQRSPAARKVMAEVAQGLGVGGGDNLQYLTQAPITPEARPDLAGLAADGKIRILLEAKFWAGLTPAQPVTYLATLQKEGGLLLFVVPETRLAHIWAELLRVARRAEGEGILPQVSQSVNPPALVGTVVMGLISWRDLLGRMIEAARRGRDDSTVDDLRQLNGLCERMDSEAFLPLRQEELNPAVGRRIYQFCELVDTLATEFKDAPVQGQSLLRSAGGQGWYGRYLRIKKYGCFLHYSSYRWSRWGSSPLWLWVKNASWKPAPELADTLGHVCGEIRVDGDVVYLPVPLETDVEHAEVIQRCKDWLEAVKGKLPDVDEPAAHVTDSSTDGDRFEESAV